MKENEFKDFKVIKGVTWTHVMWFALSCFIIGILAAVFGW